ncbi:MAG: hypothetical protein QOJ74_1987 [Ilumatobacteraceae bacterium]|nr:hypothetical protein [Ilumatobacteraceae bacterium]
MASWSALATDACGDRTEWKRGEAMPGTYAAAVQRVLIGRLVGTCGAVVLVVGTFLPWLRSGTRQRNSYDIFSLVERLGYSRSHVIGWGLRLWPVLPVLIAVAVTLLWFPHRGFVGPGVVVAVVYAGLVSIAVRSASPGGIISVQAGPTVTFVGALLLAVGYLLTLSRADARRRGPPAPGGAPRDGRS